MPSDEPQEQRFQSPGTLPGQRQHKARMRAGRPGLAWQTLHEIKRFSLAGVINTIIGTSLIFLLQAATGNPYFANTLGYLLAGIAAYFLHAKFTFRAQANQRSASLFALIAISGYLLNLIVLQQSLRVTGAFTAQTAAILSYAAYSYCMQSRFAFPAHLRGKTSGSRGSMDQG